VAVNQAVTAQTVALETHPLQVQAKEITVVELLRLGATILRVVVEVQAQSVALLLQTHHPLVTVAQALRQVQILAAVLMQAAAAAVLIVEQQVQVVAEAEALVALVLELLEP
jgi:hypothetical protein